MSRYRKIDVRVWGDAAFRRLSRSNPSGQFLWLYLLTNPNTTNIPGLYKLGEMQAAEELGWTLEGFREAFREAFREGLVDAYWEARLVFIPGAIKYNSPESPNVVKSWKSTWDELPECLLKNTAYDHFLAYFQSLSKAFQEAFREGCPKPSGKALPKPLPKAMANQEQEQEQEQENKDCSELAPPTREPTCSAYPTCGNGLSEWTLTERQVEEWEPSYPAVDVRLECRRALDWIKANPRKRKTPAGMLPFLVHWLSKAQNESGRSIPKNSDDKFRQKQEESLNIIYGDANLSKMKRVPLSIEQSKG